MRYGSVCSGIEAATVAWHPLGWEPVFFAEIEKFPSAVLKHHYPEVPNLGDFTRIQPEQVGAIDLLVGGTPCQSFSVAGLRCGMDDDRGQLALEFLRLADRLRPRWVVWENVPGVLSSNGGRDFGSFLGGLVELGYGFAYRVLDAQYFGVPQRRRRVFVVGHLGDWRRAAAVLFERHSLSGHHPPSREAGKRTASSFTPSSHGGYSQGCGTLRSNGGDLGGGSETLIAGGSFDWPADVAQTLDSHFGDKMGLEDQHIRGGQPCSYPQLAHAVTCHQVKGGDPTTDNYVVTGGSFDAPIGLDEEQNAVVDGFGTLKARERGGGNNKPALMSGMAVRRLTPRECERLQGFPDDYTKISDKTADGPRYKSLGNSMAVPVMHWMGYRIAEAEGLTR